MEVKDVLKSVPLIQGLSEEELGKLATIAQRRSFSKDEVILAEDSRGGDIYIVEQGRVRVKIRIKADSPKKEVIQTLKEGEVFGELSFLDDSPRSATVEAADDVRVLVIEKEALKRLMEGDHHLGFMIMGTLARTVAKRLRDTNMLFRSTITW